MITERKGHSANEHIWFDSQWIPELTSLAFSPAYWHAKGAMIGSAAGRGTTHFFQYGDHQFVLRHYRRGGAVGRILDDQYFYTGLNNTRACQETTLLQQLQALNLPAPIPVAYRVSKHRWYYQADLITLKIPNALDVHQVLQQRQLTQQEWQSIGRVIKQFHQHQVFHHDLNIHNIMLDDNGKVWLIDFDKCAIKSGDKWKQSNLQRLLRSLNKEQQRCSGYHFKSQNWDWLKKAYMHSNSLN